MDISGIATEYYGMMQENVQQACELAVTKKAMDFEEGQAMQLIESLNGLSAVSFGHQLNVLV